MDDDSPLDHSRLEPRRRSVSPYRLLGPCSFIDHAGRRCRGRAVRNGRCAEHQDADRRPSAALRGYDEEHRQRFRAGVLERYPVCALCCRPSTHADHYPMTRRELVECGLDANDPRYGRGLCASCHSSETNLHDGGFGHPRRREAGT